jgi:hypothetical protein
MYGVQRLTVSPLLRRLNVELRQVGQHDDKVAEACRLYPECWSLVRLADRSGVDDMTVRRCLLLAGVIMRPPHDRFNTWLAALTSVLR